jgi:hypothetical protein
MIHKARIPMILEITYAYGGDDILTLDEIANLVSLTAKSHNTDELDILNYHWEATYTVAQGSVRPPRGVKV